MTLTIVFLCKGKMREMGWKERREREGRSKKGTEWDLIKFGGN